LIGGAIAVRNLTLRADRPRADGPWVLVTAFLLVAILVAAELASSKDLLGASAVWASIGIVGQAIWVARFPIQWWASERSGSSRFPVAFWWTSLAGNLLLLLYALHLRDPVFVLGFVLGPVIQARNLVLARGSRATARSR
jgi:lipid-A-disaccharide synthase-like uncharacterized protein